VLRTIIGCDGAKEEGRFDLLRMSVLLAGQTISEERRRPCATSRSGAIAPEVDLATTVRPAEPVETPKLRILFVTEEDPIYVIQFFEAFLAAYPRVAFELSGITIQRAFHESIWKTMRRMLSFYGPFGFLRQGLRFVETCLRGRSIEALAIAADVRILRTGSVNQWTYVEQVRAIAPDVIVSVAAPEIFKAELLGVPRLGCINVHSGRLPLYRGMMPVFWQMLQGERFVTITIHMMAEKLDAGAVLATRLFPIKPRDSLDRVIAQTKREGARLLVRVLEELRAGRAKPALIDMAHAGYFSFPKTRHVRDFRKRGHRLF
jgi:methionyl-tRNA formyltransferase